MALYPKIDSPCPYKGELSAILDGDVCRLCKREVFDLTAMGDAERVAFMKGCAGEVCVTYRMPMRTALAAVALVAAVVAVPTVAAACSDPTEEEVVITTGGIKDPANVQYVKDTSDRNVPAVPVVYEPKQESPQPVNSAKAPS
jgi:predicted Fe-S protein YdhL (DUF1289 family)